jgi:hypothetical protein
LPPARALAESPAERVVKVDVPTSPATLALHGGRCPECRAAIQKGEPIVEVKATKAWVHVEYIPVAEARF